MLDVYINKSFKDKMRNEYLKWMEGADVEFTKSGKRKRASYEEVASWVQRAWDQIDPEMVKVMIWRIGTFSMERLLFLLFSPSLILQLVCYQKSFVGCGMAWPRAFDSLHSRLQDMIDMKQVSFDEEHTGHTDDEDDIVSCVETDD